MNAALQLALVAQVDSLTATLVPAVVTLALVGGAVRYVDARRAKRRARWRAYFHEGGLVRSLMRNWSKEPRRLTDQRDRLG